MTEAIDSNTTFNRTFLTIDDLIDKNLLKVEILIMTTVFILALVGNSIVVLTFLVRLFVKTGFSKNKLSRMNFYIFHLSIADIYVSLGKNESIRKLKIFIITISFNFYRKHSNNAYLEAK